MRPEKIPAPHIGEFLLEDWLKPLKLSQYQLAKDIKVPAIRISEIVRGKRNITVDTAIRLEKYFGASAEYWLRMQARCDIELAEEQREKIEKDIIPYKTAKKQHKAEKSHSQKSNGQIYTDKAITKHSLQKIALHR